MGSKDIIKSSIIAGDWIDVQKAFFKSEQSDQGHDWILDDIDMEFSIMEMEGYIMFDFGQGMVNDPLDGWGNSALHTACQEGKYEIALNLIKILDADPNVINAQGETPLHCAAREGNMEIVDLLLTKVADPKCENNSSQTPAEIAEECGNQEAADALRSEPSASP